MAAALLAQGWSRHGMSKKEEEGVVVDWGGSRERRLLGLL